MGILFRISLALLIFLGCQKNKLETEFEVLNKTSTNIDSVIVTNWNTDYRIKILRMKDSVKFDLDFRNIEHMGDGSYAIFYYIAGHKFSKDFGYFSNGNPTNSMYRIEIYDNDTVIIKEQILNYRE